MVSIATSARAAGESADAKRRVWLAIGLITLAACGTVRLPVRTFAELARGRNQDQAGNHERLRHLNQQLPASLADTGGPAAWIWSIAAVFFPCWGAHAVICAGSRSLPSTRKVRALRLSLAVGTGLGLSSVTHFLWLLMFGMPQNMFLLADILFWCLLVFICRPSDHAAPNVAKEIAGPRYPAQPQFPFSRPTACLFAIIAVIALAGLIGQCQASPDGGWDAQAIWNLRARYLFRAGDDWRGAFSANFDHTDYPLLIPGALARFWTFLGSDAAWPGASLGIAFTLATVTLLVAALGSERRWSVGLLAGIVLLGTVRLLRWGALQYADIPLAFFILATVWLLACYDQQQSTGNGQVSSGLIALAGLMMGLAAWTKNEGLIFAVVVLITRLVLRALQLGWKQSLREARTILAGALPLLIVLLLFKSQVSAANDLVASQGLVETTGRLLNPARHLTILKAFVAAGFQIANAFVAVIPLTFLLLGRHQATSSDRSDGQYGFAFVATVLGTMLAAYYVAYLTTPYELRWHLSTSIDRLLLQLWPAAVLTIFRLVRAPEEIWPTAARGPGFQLTAVPNTPHAFGRRTQSGLRPQATKLNRR